MGIKVVATRRGFFDQLLEPGHMFEIPSKKYFNEKWMRLFDDGADSARPAPRRVKRKTSKVIENVAETLAEAGEQSIPDDSSWD